MSTGREKCSKIRHIVRLRQMFRRWRNKAAQTSRQAPSDVPAGYVAVCVGINCRRFLVRATHLNHPIFQKLLVQAEEEFGFINTGPLVIPCDEAVFEKILRYLSRTDSNTSSGSGRFASLEDFQRYCNVGYQNGIDFWTESRPLIPGFSDKVSW